MPRLRHPQCARLSRPELKSPACVTEITAGFASGATSLIVPGKVGLGMTLRPSRCLRTFMAWHRASGRRDPAGFRFPQELFRLGVAGAKPGFNPGIDFTLYPTDPPLADMDRPWKPTADD